MIESDDGCKGYRISTTDGDDFDCEYPYAGEITCEECIFGPFPDIHSLDPRIPRYKEEDNG